MTLSNQQRVEKLLSRALTVRQLIKILEKVPPDAYVGAVGHFGEFHPLTKWEVNYSPTREVYVTPEFWRHDYRVDLTGKVVEFEWPDIGPEPD